MILRFTYPGTYQVLRAESSPNRSEKQSQTGVTAEVSPEMRTAKVSDAKHPSSVGAHEDLPDLTDDENGTLRDEPEKKKLQLKNPTGTDVLNDLPMQNAQQDQESDEPPSGTFNGDDERNDGLIQDESVNLRSPPRQPNGDWPEVRRCPPTLSETL
ncbi:uncharacterized protein LOC122340940 [Tachysurus ichikawai]